MTTAPDYSISTPENVDLHLDLAGLANRILACLVDTSLTYLALALLILPAFFYSKLIDFLGPLYSQFKLLIDTVTVTGLIIGSFLIVFGYFIFFEVLWQGQTPGKRLFGIRVVDSLGQPVGASSVWIRNLLRPIDEGICLLGLLVMFADRHERRLGDLAASTLVIRERLPAMTPDLVRVQRDKNFHIDTGLISIEEYQLITEFLQRRSGMIAKYRKQLASQLADHFIGKFRLTESLAEPETLIENVFIAYRDDLST
jgi:uncharacterized RDD family membrane protein YckC